MPLPRPKKDEKKTEYVKRFMKNKTAKDEFPESDQRVAVAYERYNKKGGSKKKK